MENVTTQYLSLRKKCPYSELCWSALSLIRTEYGEILRISLFSVRMQENPDLNNSKFGRISQSIFFFTFNPLTSGVH